MKKTVDLSDLAEKLPPIIARSSAEQLLGGVITAKYLANLDSLGDGPKRFRVGRKVVYRTDDLLKWLSERTHYLN